MFPITSGENFYKGNGNKFIKENENDSINYRKNRDISNEINNNTKYKNSSVTKVPIKASVLPIPLLTFPSTTLSLFSQTIH